MSVYSVSKVVVANVGHDEKICSPDSFFKKSFCFSCAKTGTAAVYELSLIHIYQHDDLVEAEQTLMQIIDELDAAMRKLLGKLFSHCSI